MKYFIILLLIPVLSITISGLTSDYLTHSDFIDGMVVLGVVGINALIISLFYKYDNEKPSLTEVEQ